MPIPLNLPNFLNAPIQKTDYSGLTNLPMKLLEAYQMPMKMEQEEEERKLKNELMRAKKGYLDRMPGERSSNAQSEGLRIWRSLPPDVRNDMLAQGSAWGFSPEEIAMGISQGKGMDDFKEAAKERGVDVDNAEKIYAPTGRTRSSINELEGYRSELKVLENEYRDDVKDYNNYLVFGYSPSQVVDQIKGENPEKQAKFLAKRALLSAMAGVRTRIEGGSNAQEALHDLREKSLGETKIFRSFVNADVYDLTQKYIDSALDKGADARIKAMKGMKKTPMRQEESMREALSQGSPKTYQFRGQTITDEDLENTAKRKGIPVEQLKQIMGI